MSFDFFPSVCVGCLFLRSPSRVPYRTELLPRAPNGGVPGPPTRNPLPSHVYTGNPQALVPVEPITITQTKTLTLVLFPQSLLAIFRENNPKYEVAGTCCKHLMCSVIA
jgi:hypothetical protein